MKSISTTIPKHLLPLSSSVTPTGLWDCALTRAVRALQTFQSKPIVVYGGDLLTRRICQALEVPTVVAPPRGEAVAVQHGSAEITQDRPIVVWSGDNIFASADVRAFIESAFDRAIATTYSFVSDSSRYTLLKLKIAAGAKHETALVTDLLEKPKGRRAGPAKLGLYLFQPPILQDLLRRPVIDGFGEWSMTELLRQALLARIPIGAFEMRAGFVDIGTPGAYLGVAGRNSRFEVGDEDWDVVDG